jgi:hypothetical protein
MVGSESDSSSPLERAGRIVRRALTLLPNSAPDYMSNHYRPSAQRDVGKSAAEAANVQLILEFLNQPDDAA